LVQKNQAAEQAAKREEQLTKQQEMETLKQLKKRYSSKFKTRASLDRELKQLQDLINATKGSFDPALNAEAEIAFVEHQTLLPLCQSPKYASVTDLGIEIASLEERIMKMQIGKERTKAAKDLHELKQRLNCEQRDEASRDPNGELIFFNLDACCSA
jgi:molybdopterin converting factor small subunit